MFYDKYSIYAEGYCTPKKWLPSGHHLIEMKFMHMDTVTADWFHTFHCHYTYYYYYYYFFCRLTVRLFFSFEKEVYLKNLHGVFQLKSACFNLFSERRW